MSFETQAALDAARKAVRAYLDETASEKQAPEDRENLAIVTNDIFEEYYQMKDFGKFSLAAVLQAFDTEAGAPEIALQLRVYGSWDSKETAEDAEYHDLTGGMDFVQDATLPTQIAVLEVQALASWSGVITDTRRHLDGAKYVKVEITSVVYSSGTGSYEFKNNKKV